MLTVGWDIGGVNTKAALVIDGTVRAVRMRPYELQRDPRALAPLLRVLIDELGVSAADAAHAVTMTAELSQMFRTKRDGVSFVLDAVVAAFDSTRVRVLTVDGGFVDVAEARRRPLAVAAANWAATARQVAHSHPHAVLVDIGTTSTDIIPIVDGVVSAAGLTDPDRLLSGELIYTGALRTPVEAIVDAVPYRDGRAAVSAESFALAGDVYVWRGDLAPDDYTWPTPDGRPATRAFAGERLARVVCADREMLDAPAISAIADAIAQAQIVRIAKGLERVCESHALRTAVVTGLGAFIGAAAARAAGLEVVWLAQSLGEHAARCAAAAAVALLSEGEPPIARRVEASAFAKATADICAAAEATADKSATADSAAIDIVIKIGGSLLADPAALDAILSAIASAGPGRHVLIVAGGGPFADTVREVDRRLHLSDEAAHWMAILAMDQYAHLLATRLGRGSLVHDRRAIGRAISADRVPVLAPSTWLRDRDPLPHSWDVTSDSIAAWVAGEVGASTLVLVKPVGAAGPDLVDGYFARALRPDIAVELVTANQRDRLRAIVSGVGCGAASAEAAARS